MRPKIKPEQGWAWHDLKASIVSSQSAFVNKANTLEEWLLLGPCALKPGSTFNVTWESTNAYLEGHNEFCLG